MALVQKLRTTPTAQKQMDSANAFNQTLFNMIGTLPTHAKKNWQEWVPTLVSTYNSTVSNAMGFSLYFLMYGPQPFLPIDIEFGVTQANISGPPTKIMLESLR